MSLIKIFINIFIIKRRINIISLYIYILNVIESSIYLFFRFLNFLN